ncbi:transcription-repair coupling factor [Schaalia hyovaginalis]|uniref:transcription-repair coupling factor n=1 Tax=Schaalia hyovaginalis TaxID=29316 RepID=UPI0026E9ADCE|nr:transcription-repair coupling factor [Schaalia hyovaginalis]MCI6556585.1 transcription-repair coupling factor [Schaalia hyovaginalis]MDD7554693.1 transcription-repair coupling factor [Schaalia hyovaginalis]MDY3092871.1 transcription-repair coupling factor [Schaalia hyovaginalis]
MILTGLARLIESDAALDRATGSLASGRSGVLVMPKGARPPAIAALARSAQARPALVLTATGRDAERLTNALRSWIDGVEMMPAWETLPHERLSPQVDTMARRIAVLRRLAHPVEGDKHAGPISVLVVPIRAFLQPVISGLGELEPVRVRPGDRVDLEDLAHRLAALGYERVDMVESRGQLSVRGGILDVFPPQEAHPVRVELWDDEVDEIRAFSVQDQRTLGLLEEGLWAPACRELLLTDAVRARARDLSDDLPGAAEMLSLASEGIAAPGIESLAPVLASGMDRLIDLVPKDSPILAADPERIRARAADLVATTEEFLAAAWSVAAGGGATPLQASAASFLHLDDLIAEGGRPWWELTELPPAELAGIDEDAHESVEGGASPSGPRASVVSPTLMRMGMREVRPYRGDFAAACHDLKALADAHWTIVVATEGPGPAKRIRTILAESGLHAAFVEDLGQTPEAGTLLVTTAQAEAGFVAPELKLAILTESDLTGRAGASTRDMRKMPSRRKKGIDPLALHPGDYIVHDQHGIGRFIELVSRTVGRADSAVTRDYLVLEYAPSKRGQPGDRLYVPTDSLDQISKYTGSDQPALTKMGGAEWAKTKARAKKAVNEVAKELIRLYAARQATRGRAFGPDTPWQRELEDAFPYVETPDQLVTIDEVKADMEKSVPMDRLLTGDVGYGKTEIAVRAAFKAIQDGAQVAVLVPTTLLVQQHVETFTERYAGFPVSIASLSRFSSAKEAEEVKAGLASGKIDLVIGTHSLLTGTVSFKNLGLVVIDEEQRFGVEHKETLKALRTDVDVLSMSATPIPRTLEMAVSGIREMSILQTPPEERQPVLTFVGSYTDQQVSAAIRRELLRDGQVFFVHNRVDSITSVAAHVQELVPEARIRVAHGKLSEHQLEEVIVDFWNHEFDVLVCTTIVETGLDISNANTLIVDRADVFGLSQLHQLRGRVGRGRERAYAYFFYPGDKTLTETAHERLKTIAANTDLGAGLAVAQKDLEIRGAGNLLGGAQSGHIEGVGFDLYVRMVADAVAMFKGEVPEVKPALRLDIPVDAHIPESYVPGERLRLEVYGKIAAVATAEQEADLRDELADRYGPIPRQVELLFAVARMRELLRSRGLEEAVLQGKYLRVNPIELRESQVLRLKRLHSGTVIKAAVRQLLVPVPMTKRMGGDPLTDESFLEWLEVLVTKVLTPFER